MCSTSPCPYIPLDQLSCAGALFVATADPLSLAFRSITRKPFSCRGFYYTTTITGTLKIKLIVRDYFNDLCPLWINDPNAITIDDLISCPLITQIYVKPLELSSKEIENAFRTAVAETMSLLSELSIDESLARLWSPLENEDLLHKVQLNMLDKLKSESTSFFADGVYLTLPPRITSLTDFTSVPYQNRLKTVTTLVLDRLCQDKELFDKTVKQIKQVAQECSYESTTLRQLLKICLDNESTLLFKLIKWIESGDISYNELRNLLAMINNQRREISLILNEDNATPLALPEAKANLLLRINVDKSYSNKESLMSNAIKDLHGKISEIVSSIQRNEPIYIDINNIIKCMNIISSHVETDLHYIRRIDEDSSYPALVVTHDDQTQELQLKSGTVITLSLKRPQLEGIDKETLIQILEVLDSLVENDKKYEDLRVALTKQVAMS